MIKRTALTSNLSLSRVVYGMWRLGDDDNTYPAHIQAKIEACLEQGVTTMDQADIYGGYECEALLGTCFKEAPHLREKVEIITKCGIVAPAGRYSDVSVKQYNTSPAHIDRSINNSLRLMGVDHIDLLLIHRPDPFMDHTATGRALDEAVTSGKVRAVGVSNFRPHDWTLLQSAMSTKLATNQIELSLLAHDPFANGDLAFLQERGVSPMAWSPLAGGALFAGGNPGLFSALERVANEGGVDVTAVAVAWLLAHPANIIPVMGTNRVARIEKLGDATKVNMTRETWFELYTAALGREVA